MTTSDWPKQGDARADLAGGPLIIDGPGSAPLDGDVTAIIARLANELWSSFPGGGDAARAASDPVAATTGQGNEAAKDATKSPDRPPPGGGFTPGAVPGTSLPLPPAPAGELPSAPYFLDLTCYASLSPMRRDVVEPLEQRGGIDAVNHLESVVTNGAYTLEDWKFRYEIRLKKSPTYWRAAEVKIDHVVWTMVEDNRSTLNLYKAGDLDSLGDTASIPIEAMPFV